MNTVPLSQSREQRAARAGSAALGGTSFAVSAVGAVCAFFIVLSKIGILVGFTSFLLTVIASRAHAVAVRVPLLSGSFIGAAANLFMLWNGHRLRTAPAAAWRRRPLSLAERWRISLLIAMGVTTLVLIAAEFWIHPIHVF